MKRTLLALTALTLAAPAGADPATPDVRVNSPGPTEVTSMCNEQHDVAVARSGDAVVAAWTGPGTCERNTLPTPADSSAAYAWSSDGGASWTDGGSLPLNMLGTTYGRVDVAAHPDGSFVYVAAGQEPTVAEEPDPYGRSVIAAFRSTDGGRTWGAPVDVSRIPGSGLSTSAASPVAAIDAAATSPYRGTVYVVWGQYENSSFNHDAYIARSTDGGRTFDQPRWLGPEIEGLQLAFGPRGEVYAVWRPGQSIVFSRSLDGGATFSSPEMIATLSRVGHLHECGAILGYQYVIDGDIRIDQDPSIAVDTFAGAPGEPNPTLGRLYVAVAADGIGADEADVYLTTSDDRGDTWKPMRRVNDDGTSTDQFLPEVTVNGLGRVAMIWHDRRLSASAATPNLGMDVFGTISADGGRTFAPAQRLSDVTTLPGDGMGWRYAFDPCYFPQQRNALTAVGDRFLAAWADNRSGTAEAPDLDVFAETFG